MKCLSYSLVLFGVLTACQAFAQMPCPPESGEFAAVNSCPTSGAPWNTPNTPFVDAVCVNNVCPPVRTISLTQPWATRLWTTGILMGIRLAASRPTLVACLVFNNGMRRATWDATAQALTNNHYDPWQVQVLYLKSSLGLPQCSLKNQSLYCTPESMMVPNAVLEEHALGNILRYLKQGATVTGLSSLAAWPKPSRTTGESTL